MTTDQAVQLLTAQRAACARAIDELRRYRRERDNWLAAVRADRVAEVRALASAGGVDLSGWGGA